MSTQPPPFDDPALKEAVRRAWSRQSAPQEVHRRVREALASASAEAPAPREAVRAGSTASMRLAEPLDVIEARRRVHRGLAVAAGIVLAVGISVTVMRNQSPPPGTPVQLAGELPASLVIRHDECAKAPDHHKLGVSRDDFTTIASELQSQTGHAVLAKPVGDGWQFIGAGPCPVNGVPSGHLVFAKGADRLSLISLPASVLSRVAPQSPYNGEDSGHVLAGFIQNDMFVCLVGSSPQGTSGLTQIQPLRDRLRTEAATAVAAGRDLKPADFAVLLAKCLK
jgi:hypothetical protein